MKVRMKDHIWESIQQKGKFSFSRLRNVGIFYQAGWFPMQTFDAFPLGPDDPTRDCYCFQYEGSNIYVAMEHVEVVEEKIYLPSYLFEI